MSTQGNALAGSLAATLQATEIFKLIAGEREHSIAGSEVLFDARHQSHCSSRLDRNPHCRFSHEHFSLNVTQNLTLAAAFALTSGPNAQKRLFVPDSAFVARLVCTECGNDAKLWRLRESLSFVCPECAKPCPIRGIDLVECLSAGTVEPELLDHTLVDLGFRPGEVFAIEGEDAARCYFVLDESGASATHDLAGDGVSLVVAGLGNIGSFLAPLLARMEAVSHVVLCDPDDYEVDQQIGQDIPANAVGRNKAAVQTERLRAIRPELRVETFAAPVEHLPLGRLHGAIVVSCLDSRSARLHLAARAWRVSSPFVDAAVGGGSSLLVRTNVYMPAPDAACFECAFDAHDYESLEQIFPCAAEAVRDEKPAPERTRNPEPRLSAGVLSTRVEV